MRVSLNIKHPEYIMLSSDFSQQEPKLTAFVSQEHNLIKAFQEGRDVYATLASLAFNTSYENCLEFNPKTGEYQPEGKKRRNEAKTILLGITYGRSVPSIGQQLYGHDDTMSEEEKTKNAQRVYDSVMKAFPDIEKFMRQAQAFARTHGYVETILGRRRHLPDMMLDEFEFEPLPGYVNPNVDPLDLSTMDGESGIPEDILKELRSEFSKYKYFGQIAKRTKQLYENDHIKVINNRPKINDARRQCVNCVDLETEILTLDGWKCYDEVKVGDRIVAYSLKSHKLVKDTVGYVNVIKYPAPTDEQIVHLKTKFFDSICTWDHRWVVENFDTKEINVYTANRFLSVHRPRYHILRIADNDINKASIVESVIAESIEIRAGRLDYSRLFSYSQNDSIEVYNYFKDHVAHKGSIIFESKEAADRFQVLAIMAGKCVNQYEVNKKNKKVWKVSCPNRDINKTARIDYMKKNKVSVEGVWCVSTHTSTWIARRNGSYYITGNSIIQGSAADFTKSALLEVYNDQRWRNVGGEILTVVHDEIVAQVPIDRWEEGAEILKSDMEGSGSFLPFPIKCDVTSTYRWYGLEVPCKFSKPNEINFEDENCCSWIQWHLVELGYSLPIFKDDNGNSPIGDAAHGVSGKYSVELEEAINSYCIRYHTDRSNFIDDIESRVEVGL